MAEVVDKQTNLSVEIAHQHVDVAVIVDVSERRAATHLHQLQGRARLVGDVLEPPVPGIAEQEIYVANDGRANLLWMNQRDGTFTDVGLVSGTSVSADGKPEASMGVDVGDVDNDGDEDLIMTHLPTEGNNLYVNDGSGLFEDRSAASRFHEASLGYSGWGTACVDFDNDGWLDILVANGALDVVPGRPDDPFPYDERRSCASALRTAHASAVGPPLP